MDRASKPVCRLALIVLAATCVVAAGGCDAVSDRAPGAVVVPVPLSFEPLPVPPQNPLTPERVRLGERLFFDPVLSSDGAVSCASCHHPDRAFADARALSRGVQGREGLRNAPSLLNVAYRKTLFWDGGALFLESQALVPLEDPREMDLPIADALARLNADAEYRSRFARAFDGDSATVQTLSYALASFERTLVSAPTAYDRFLSGDVGALTADERAGLAVFERHCQTCHAGPQLTNDGFANNGVEVTDDDPGRERVSFVGADRGSFRVPSLRGVARTAPYFHDGRHVDLSAVVDHYTRGGGATDGQSPLVRPLALSPAERSALLAFLATLDDEPADIYLR